MPTIIAADYHVFVDGTVELQIGADIDRDLEENLPNDIRGNANAILFWNDRKEGQGTDVIYTITLNGQQIRPDAPNYTVSSGLYYTRQEVVPGSVLRAGDENTLRLRVLDGTGRLSVTDVFMMFKRNIEV
jgi:hypothetical protein